MVRVGGDKFGEVKKSSDKYYLVKFCFNTVKMYGSIQLSKAFPGMVNLPWLYFVQ